MKKISNILLSLVFVLLCAGCAKNLSPNVYSSSEVGITSHVVHATIMAKRTVKIDNQSGVGGLAGTAAGAAAGSAIGGDPRVAIVGAIGGAVIGGVAGRAIDQSIHKKQGYEYILQLKNHSTIAITQIDNLNLKVGQKVLVIYGDMTRIIPDTSHGQSKSAK